MNKYHEITAYIRLICMKMDTINEMRVVNLALVGSEVF